MEVVGEKARAEDVGTQVRIVAGADVARSRLAMSTYQPARAICRAHSKPMTEFPAGTSAASRRMQPPASARYPAAPRCTIHPGLCRTGWLRPPEILTLVRGRLAPEKRRAQKLPFVELVVRKVLENRGDRGAHVGAGKSVVQFGHHPR